VLLAREHFCLLLNVLWYSINFVPWEVSSLCFSPKKSCPLPCIYWEQWPVDREEDKLLKFNHLTSTERKTSKATVSSPHLPPSAQLPSFAGSWGPVSQLSLGKHFNSGSINESGLRKEDINYSLTPSWILSMNCLHPACGKDFGSAQRHNPINKRKPSSQISPCMTRV